jgi:hypothetical protein
MNRALRFSTPALLLFLTGCVSLVHRTPPLGHTTFSASAATLPAETFGNVLVVTARWDRYGPYHFLVDTGSSVTLVTPEFAARYRDESGAVPPGVPQVEVQSGAGGAVILPTAVVSRIDLGAAHFARVPVVVYDCAPLTAQLGIRIDGILGFPLFNQTLLTLDYRHNRVVLRPNASLTTIRPFGTEVPFNNADTIPLITVQLGERRFLALIDSGSDSALSLNTSGLAPRFVFGPVQGPTVGTLAGDRTRQVGRLAQTLLIGDYSAVQPVTEVSDEWSAIGGGILKDFTVTFDQLHGEATFYRDSGDPITTPGILGTGLSFGKTPAYWRVVGVVPGSPADRAGIETGDLVTRIDGDPVSKWGFHRYEAMLANDHDVTLTFLNGTTETSKRVAIVPLVP